MEEQFKFDRKYRNTLVIIGAAGMIAVVLGMVIFKPGVPRVWANVLLNNQFFLAIALGSAFFLAVHRIAWSGWHTALQRLPESMASFLPVAFVLMLVVYFGMEHLYHWSHYEGHDPVIEGKKAWLNVPFFFIRMLIYFGGWIALTWLMRRNTGALAETGDLSFYNRRRVYAAIFLVFFAITVSTSSWDWLMSLDAHWFSTIFGWYVFIGMFVTSLAVLILVLWFLKRAGYLSFIRTDHVRDLSKLLFAFSIFWTYLWFSQYMLIWFGHLPEETVYYIDRLEDFKLIFYLNLGLNFIVPFFGLMKFTSKENLNWVALVAGIVMIGHWIDYYLMIMPSVLGQEAGIGLLEIGSSLVYASLFLFVVLRSLSKGPLLVKKDPFLEESMNYEA